MFIESVITLMILSLAVFLVPPRFKWAVSIGILGTGAMIGCLEAASVLYRQADIAYSAGINLVFGTQYGVMDSLSALFVIILSVAAVSVGIYAQGYLKPYLEKKSPVQLSIHYFCLLIMYFSMMLVVTFRDGFGFLFAWELMTVSSFLLILFDAHLREVRQAALNYLILMHIGFVFLLIGFVSLYTHGLPVSFDALGQYFSQGKVLPLFIVFLIGFGMKAGMFPLHVWLPEAHPAAPAHISAFMSGVMIKMGIYGIFRVVSYIDSQLFTVGVIILVVGAATGLWGVILAVLQSNIKKLLAYSSIENVGIILIGLGVGLIGKARGDSLMALCGIAGALLHTVNHSFFKTLLFLGAGNVYSETHTLSLDALGGLRRRMPVTAILFLVGTLAICALPPFNGFVSEFMIYLGFFDGITTHGLLALVSIFGIIVLALVGGLVVMAFTKLYGVVFLGSARSTAVSQAHEVSAPMIVGMAFPLAGILMVGFAPFWASEWVFGIAGRLFGINQTPILYGMVAGSFVQLAYALAILVLLVGGLWFVRWLVTRRRPSDSSPTWACGFTAVTPKMQYTGESFSEGFQRLSRGIIRSRNVGDAIGKDEIFPDPHNFETQYQDKIDSLFEAWWVGLIRRINSRFSRLRSGKVNHYILYAMLFLGLIFILSVLKVM